MMKGFRPGHSKAYCRGSVNAQSHILCTGYLAGERLVLYSSMGQCHSSVCRVSCCARHNMEEVVNLVCVLSAHKHITNIAQH